MRQINDKHDELRGSIDKLIEHNEKTRNRARGSQRYCDSSIEIAQISYLANRVVNTRAISDYLRQNPRKRIPNPFIAKLWKDDDFYLKSIGAEAKTLSPDQVRMIGELWAKGRSVADIAEEVGALNETQVKEYYCRQNLPADSLRNELPRIFGHNNGH